MSRASEYSMKRDALRKILVVAACAWIVTAGFTFCRRDSEEGRAESPEEFAKASNRLSDYTSEAYAWADAVVAAMDTSELAGQLVMPASYASADAATLSRMRRYIADDKIGGVVWLRGDTASMRILADSLGSHSRWPLFMAIDAEWGLAMRLEGTREYPKNYRLSHLQDDTLYDYGRDIGMDARRLGLNVVLAPVLDVSAGQSSVMFARSYGDDPQTVADKGCSFARGLADAGVIPVAKHFPGLGATREDSHRTLPVVADSRATIEGRDLAPFRQFVNLHLGGVMIGHVSMPAIDSIIRPATFSPVVVKDLLRDSMRFDGLVFSDGMNMKALDDASDEKDSSRYVKALKAGADILIAPLDTDKALAEIRRGIATGELPLSEVREKVRRIMFYKYPYYLL